MWAVDIQDCERICDEIERALSQKDMFLAISVVREAFSRPRAAVFIEDHLIAARLKSELVPISHSCLVDSGVCCRS